MTFYIEANIGEKERCITVEAITVEEAEEKAHKLLGEGYFIQAVSTFQPSQRS
jgi:hypothetical protein|tara:strand:+ start:2678 stop:2836 length:159 start_codon:yes stop_codon:yes gene_type:complete